MRSSPRDLRRWDVTNKLLEDYLLEVGQKGSKSFFGHKGHILIDTEHHLIKKIETTTASLHDSQVDLGIEGLPRYADKGYDGAKTRGYDVATKNAARNHKLISRKRSHIERCFAVMKRAHNTGHVSVTTIAGAGIKFMRNSIVYKLVQVRSKNDYFQR